MNLPLSLDGLASSRDPLLLLRQGTQTAHEAVESIPAMRRLFAADYSIDEYRRLLLALWPFLHALEADLLSAGQHDRIRASVSRAGALHRDLLALGEPQASLPPPKLAHAVPIACESERAGVLYVLEGSALGGQLIRRALLQRFGAEAGNWCQYFDCHSGNAGRRWRAYGQALREHPTIDTGMLVAAAQLTFQRFGERLGKLPATGPLPLRVAKPAPPASACPFARARQLFGRVDSLGERLRQWWRT